MTDKLHVILVIDDERRFVNHPDHDRMFFASSAEEALPLLADRETVVIDEIWLDFVIKGLGIRQVIDGLLTIANEDPAFAKSVLLRTCTGSPDAAEDLRGYLSPPYTFGEHVYE